MYEITTDHKPLNMLARGVEEILQNIAIILTTPKGSVTLDRDFGIDMSALDLPLEMAENICTAQIIEAIQDYEPRVKVAKVTYEKEHLTGVLKPKVQVVINEY
ncbi:GPW/gp25 family protein [Niameybacter massiliensis]|uniref:GPW/gp25 family protein n=1 Tax=Holtiella tumoricola TaxID=3018743 RepID=A0AA42DM57_9FIRM|nr:GPW/gp25 family protein [Holtiella tumoricola]MDA3731677.1 GPW/gp25 family protein [Holtiella tumoricola]